MTITALPRIPLTPTSISVEGPDRGRYNLMSGEESDRYIVRVDGIVCSTTVDLERSDEITDLDWPDKILAIAADASRWITTSAITASRAAVHEWINRDDPEDERRIAIEEAQTEHEAQVAFRQVRRLPRAAQARVFALLKEVTL